MALYQAGDLISNRYRVVEALSSGGMGAVYVAEQIALGRDVAIKVILAHHQDSEDLRLRFEAEARAVCQLQHPNIITYHDYGQDEQGRNYLVMEYLGGHPGTELVYGDRVPTIEESIHVVGQLCSALLEAHTQGIIHRDLKWSNVMIVPQAHDPLFTKLIDFGILKVACDGSSGDQRKELTRTGVLLGTPQYMSPEAICGKRIDGRSDIYSLAVMTYEILTGRRPFESESRLELLRLHVQEPPPPMDDIGPERISHPQLEAAILRGLAKDPRDRYDSVIDFHAALNRALGLPEPSRPSVPVRRRTSRQVGAKAAQASSPRTPIAGATDPGAVALPRTPPPFVAPASRSRSTPAPVPLDTSIPAATSPGRRPDRPWGMWALSAVGTVTIGFAATWLIAGALSGAPAGDREEVAQVIHLPAGAEEARLAPPDEPRIAGLEAAQAPLDGATPGGAADDALLTKAGGADPSAVPTPEILVKAAEALAPPIDAAAAQELLDDQASAAGADDEAPGATAEAADEPAVVAPAPRPRAAVVGTSALTIVAVPYAQVEVDGRSLGTTPIRDATLRSGRVQVRLTHPTYGTRVRTVTLRPDGRHTVNVDMRE